jgi:hypothetical protein
MSEGLHLTLYLAANLSSPQELVHNLPNALPEIPD